MKTKLYTFLAILGLATTLSAQPGTLDVGFNGKGIKEITFTPNFSSDEITTSILQPDGKLLVVVKGFYGGGVERNESTIMRLLPDGSFDQSFGFEGRYSLNTIETGFIGMSIALRADGRIVLGGHVIDADKNVIPYLLGVTVDGSKDELFGALINGTTRSGAIQLATDGGSANYYAYSYTSIQTDPSTGNIFASGSQLNGGGSNFLLATVDRYGDLANLIWNGDGKSALYSFNLADANKHTVSSSLFHPSSQTLYIGGTVYNDQLGATLNTKNFAVMALNLQTGRLVQSFFYNPQLTKGGKAVLPLTPGRNLNECTAMRFTPDSTGIFLSGYAQKNESTGGNIDIDFMLYKIRRLGGIDTKFSEDGIATYRYPGSVQNYAFSFYIQPNGKMLLGGSIGTGNSFAAVMRMNADSTVDKSFGKDGYLIYNQNNAEQFNSFKGINRLHMMPGGKYILLGNQAGIQNAFAKRVNNDGGNDNNYGKSSKTILWAFGDNTTLEDAALRPADGSLWVCGNTQYNGPAVALVKSDGSFGNTIPLASYFPANMTTPKVTAIALYQSSPILAGTYSNGSNTDLFLMRLKIDGSIDLSFGADGNGITKFNLTETNNYIHDLVIQEGKGILVYGYISNLVTLLRYRFNGTKDDSFGGGQYQPAINATSVSSVEEDKIEIKVKDNFIYGVATYTNAQSLFLIFKVDADGFAVSSYGNQFGSSTYVGELSSPSSNAFAKTLVVKSNGVVIAGGYEKGSTDKRYGFLQLDEFGALDLSFNAKGYNVFGKGLSAESVVSLQLENDNSIVATGYDENNSFHTLIRLKSDGSFDKTFGNNGFLQLAITGYQKNSVLADNSLYLVGANKKPSGATSYLGQLIKIKLGSASVVKNTTLALANLSKTFGDEPFKLQPVTNSPAQIYYTVVQSSCAEVEPLSGLVKITCATVDNNIPITIRAVQFAVNGYAAATATATITVAKVFPKVYFPSQGGITGTKFKLKSYAESSIKSDIQPSYSQYNGGTEYLLYDYQTDSVQVIAEGESQIAVYYPETRDYFSATKTATIYAYDAPVPPVANEDAAQLIFSKETSITIHILDNDEAYSGTIVTQQTDLDPSVAGIQSIYVSPSLGLFSADSNGIITYTPFTGFLGSGDISYTIEDSKGLKSEPAVIHISVEAKSEVPALKGTEMITPNNDGLNEAFVIGYVDLAKDNQLKIFDRNGQELFSQSNYRNDWTGILSNGKAVENGIYFFVFIEGNDAGQREVKGTFEVRR